MEIRRCIFLASLCICCFTVAHSLYAADDDVKKQINCIKTDEAYVAAEATDDDNRAAFDMALLNLYNSINAQRAMQGLPSVDIETLRPLVHTLTTNRGSMQRVFVYISWAEMERLSSSPTTPSDNSKKSNKDTIEVIIAIPMNSEIDKNEEGTLSSLTQTTIENQPQSISEILQSLSITETIGDALLQLASYKVEQKISDYGRYNPSLHLEGVYHLLMFDDEKIIRAILEIHEDGNIWNVTNNCPDTFDNYHGCRAFWFK